jgi:uncharacterized protein (TIGR02246 family)
MSSRSRPRGVVASFLLIVAGTVAPGDGGSGIGLGAGIARAQVSAAVGPRSEDEKAIRAVDEAFVGEFNRGDSKAVAARFTEDAEVVEADGSRYQGRELIERSFADTFAASPGAKIALKIDSIRLLSPDAAKEEGQSLVTPTSGAPLSRLYTVIYVKRDGRWLVSSVREEPDPMVSPHDRLMDLEWLIGAWVDEGSDSQVRIDCRWSEDGNFLIRTFTVKRQGKPTLGVTQRIGWDPIARQIRSWEFDSEGGFGEGKWRRDGDHWVVKHAGVRPEGLAASATNIMFRERPDLVRWVSTDRVIGEESAPGDDAYVFVRVPPAPRVPSSDHAPANVSPPLSPDTTRTPR